MYTFCSYDSVCISSRALLLTFLSYSLLFTFRIFYCIELSFGCCDAQISPFAGLIQDFLILNLQKNDLYIREHLRRLNEHISNAKQGLCESLLLNLPLMRRGKCVNKINYLDIFNQWWVKEMWYDEQAKSHLDVLGAAVFYNYTV